jgi:DNA-binding response OmpR family regulator
MTARWRPRSALERIARRPARGTARAHRADDACSVRKRTDGCAAAFLSCASQYLEIVAMPHILIADDESAIVDVVSLALQGQRGYRITAVTSGADALAAMEADRPDLVILDVQMPRISGIDVAGRAAALNTPVLFMTGAPSPDGMQATAGPCLIAKPFRLAELLVQTRALLEEREECLRRLRATLHEVEATRVRLMMTLEAASATVAEAASIATSQQARRQRTPPEGD